MAVELQQASSMSKIDRTRLSSTPWPFWTYVTTSGNKLKIMMNKVASNSNLSLPGK